MASENDRQFLGVSLAGKEHCRVTNLMKEEEIGWDEMKIKALFEDEVAEAILAIPLSQQCPIDKIRWIFIKSRCYTIRLGYYVTHMESASSSLCSTSQSKF